MRVPAPLVSRRLPGFSDPAHANGWLRGRRGEGLADGLGEHEAHGLPADLELLDVLGPAGAEELDEALERLLGGAGAGADAHDARAVQPLVLDLALVVDEVRGGAVLAGDLDQAVGV